jgi:hypothetical protein
MTRYDPAIDVAVGVQPATLAAEPAPKVSDRFVAYLLLLGALIFLLYVLPEVLVFKEHGFAPVEHLVDSGPDPSLSQIVTGMWRDRAEILNPMNNPLVRFFLVTMVVGIVFDRVKQYWPVAGDGENKGRR